MLAAKERALAVKARLLAEPGGDGDGEGEAPTRVVEPNERDGVFANG
jgi:hypothetical protein